MSAGTSVAVVAEQNIAQRDMYNSVNNITFCQHALAKEESPQTKKHFRCDLLLPTSHYKGREEILRKIQEHFNGVPAGQTGCFKRMVTIAGMGGIGKSETACKFANKYREAYPCAAWINAEAEESALDSFLRLAKKLKIVPEDRPRADLELVTKVYDHIDAEYQDKVLLIFDNAIHLHSRNDEFGILDYLPTKDLLNKRFPFVIITSQTPDWEPGITTFKLDELDEKDSLSFFRSTFNISSSNEMQKHKYDEAFRKLHKHLQGYPLAMILAASNIHFNHDKNPVKWLKKAIKRYTQKFKKEHSSILTQQINQGARKYNKTLSTVWKLTLKRLEAAPNGRNALVVLQAVSFFHVPLTQDDLRCVFIECPHCPGTPDWMKNDLLEESLQLLRKFHLVDCDFQDWNHSNELEALQSSGEISSEDLPRVRKEIKRANTFKCELRVHRLVQLVVRLDTDCSVVLEDILRYKTFWKGTYARQLNTPAVEQAFGRSRLSTRALAFVGLLALQGNLAARRIVQTTTAPLDDPAATIWRVLQLDGNIKTLNVEALEVLRAFIGLSTSEQSLIDKRCFATMAMETFAPVIILSYPPDDGTKEQGPKIQSLTEIQDIACELFSTGCSFTDVCSLPLLCVNYARSNAATFTLCLGNQIIKDLTNANKPKSEIAPIREQLRMYREFVESDKNKWPQFREELDKIFVSDDSWNKFQSEVESCGLDQLKLKQVFSSYFDEIWAATDNKNFNYSTRLCVFFRELDTFTLMYAHVLPRRSREKLIPLMESFIEILVKRDNERTSVSQTLKENEVFVAVWICSTWVNFCLQETLLSSTDLSTRFSQVRILTAIKNVETDRIPYLLQFFNDWELLRNRHKERYDIFLEIHSESTEEAIRALVPFCTNIQNKIN